MPADTYDIVIIGAGPGGEATAAHAARAGARVALVERELVGGECPYWGCMPSKAMLRPRQTLDETLRTPGAAEAATGVLDVDAALARRDEVVRHLDDSSHAGRMERLGIELIRGHARLDGERRVVVDLASGESRTLDATRAVVLAPGTRAAMPPIPGLIESRPWTNREATLATEIPRELTILGGGVIGVELAEAFTAFGSRVTIVEGAERLLLREEPEAASLVAEALARAGVTIRCGSLATGVARDGAGRVTVSLDDGSTVVGDELLVAVGRSGNVELLGLETVGITPGRGGTIAVTNCMQVPGLEWLYVVGDANGRAQLTHTAVYQAKVAARNALGIETHCVEDDVAAPRVVFTDPNVCGVGHTLQSALDAGIVAVAIDRDPQRVAAGSFHARGTTGFARLVFDARDSTIVGATFAGADLADLLHSATIAIVGQVPLERLIHCVAPFPTRSEVWTKLVEGAERHERLTSHLPA